MSTVNLSLPLLTPRYQGVPRRYEETRPVAIQEYAHRRILGIGHDIHCHCIHKTEEEKDQAVQNAEKQIWLQAEQLKAIAVQRAKDEAALEQDMVIRKLKNQNEKKMKEEALRVEMAMQKLSMEQMKQEKEEAEIKLREAVKKVEEQCHKELIQAVENARQEEKRTAATAAEQTAKSHSQLVEQVKIRAADDKQQALQALTEVKGREHQKAVKTIEEEHRRMTLDKINKLTQKYENEINSLKNFIALKSTEIKKLLKVIDALEKTNGKLENSLTLLRDEFQHFIDKSERFDAGQSDYLVPPLYKLMK